MAMSNMSFKNKQAISRKEHSLEAVSTSKLGSSAISSQYPTVSFVFVRPKKRVKLTAVQASDYAAKCLLAIDSAQNRAPQCLNCFLRKFTL